MRVHTTRQTKFYLCADDCGVKYFSKDNANHLIQILQKEYEITRNWSGANLCGLNID